MVIDAQQFHDEQRLKRDAHHDIVKAPHVTTNNRSVVCRENYQMAKQRNPRAKDKDLPKCCKAIHWCTYCEEFLCIGKPGNNCWFDWHHNVEYFVVLYTLSHSKHSS